jgi:hypothetical protein
VFPKGPYSSIYLLVSFRRLGEKILILESGAAASSGSNILHFQSKILNDIPPGTIATVGAVSDGVCNIRPVTVHVSSAGASKSSSNVVLKTTLTTLATAGDACQLNVAGSSSYIVGQGSYSSWYIRQHDSSRSVLYGVPNSTFPAAAYTDDGGYRILVFRTSPSNIVTTVHALNGDVETSESINPTSSSSGKKERGKIFVGWDSDLTPGDFFKGKIASMAIYNSFHNDTIVQNIIATLQANYSNTVGEISTFGFINASGGHGGCRHGGITLKRTNKVGRSGVYFGAGGASMEKYGEDGTFFKPGNGGDGVVSTFSGKELIYGGGGGGGSKMTVNRGLGGAGGGGDGALPGTAPTTGGSGVDGLGGGGGGGTRREAMVVRA